MSTMPQTGKHKILWKLQSVLYHSLRDTPLYGYNTPWIITYQIPVYQSLNDNPNIFGCYIDWKEETDEIIYGLKKPIENLGYPLSLDDIPFTGKEFTNKALDTIHNHFIKKGYNLIFQDTDSDCYHLFLVKTSDYDRLVKLGEEIDIKFSNRF